MAARTFYGFSHTYGADVRDSKSGARIGNYHSFPTRGSRDEWVSNGNPYFTQGGAREATPAHDPELRRLLRDETNARYYVQQHDAEGW